MCLFPFGAGGGNFHQVPPPNAKCKKFVRILMIIMIIQLILGVFYLFIDMFTGLIQLIVCMFLCQAYTQISYCGCMVYIFIAFYSFITDFAFLGKTLQEYHTLFPSENNSWQTFLIVLALISVIFYIVAMYFCFQAYREFKAVSLEYGQLGGMGLQGGFFGNMQQQQQDPEPQNYGYDPYAYDDFHQPINPPQQPYQQNYQPPNVPQSSPPPPPQQNQQLPRPGIDEDYQRQQMLKRQELERQQAQQQQQQQASNFKAFGGQGIKIG